MYKKILILIIVLVETGCASLSEQAFGSKLALYQHDDSASSSRIHFSSDKKYETDEGVPLKGEAVICSNGRLTTTKNEERVINPVAVPGNQAIYLTSVIQWENTGWTKTCWPFVKFTPEAGQEYVLVNERIGGKGASALWTGVARQSCRISVYKLDGDSFSEVEVTPINGIPCPSSGS